MPNDTIDKSRRDALKCLAAGGAGTVFVLAGGVFTPMSLVQAAAHGPGGKAPGRPLFVQISDTHIGFSKDANKDVTGTLQRTIALVNAMDVQPELILHTGDITHLAKPAEFDLAQQLLGRLRSTDLHTVPGEHDTADVAVSEYFDRFGTMSQRKGYYSFDHAGVHFVGLINVLGFKAGGLGTLGQEQIEWAKRDLAHRSSSTPIVIFAHMPLWTVYEPWGWGTADADQIMPSLSRFGSVTILNGHIHQVVQKVEGHIAFHTARSTAYPQPGPGTAPGPGPLMVPAEQLPGMLGISSVSLSKHPLATMVTDATLA